MPTDTKLPELPSNMKQLPRDDVGRPIPFFVAYVDGKPDFRIVDPPKLIACVVKQLCWVCGERLNRLRHSTVPRGTFVAGPMCVVNGTSAEPPSHAACAEWSAKACPFLTRPAKERRIGGLDAINVERSGGVMLDRNPGVTALIDSERWSFHQVSADPEINSQGGVLCRFSRVASIRWMKEGVNASPHDVMKALDEGLPALVEIAQLDPHGMRALAHKTRDALRWVGEHPGIDRYPVVASVLAEL